VGGQWPGLIIKFFKKETSVFLKKGLKLTCGKVAFQHFLGVNPLQGVQDFFLRSDLLNISKQKSKQNKTNNYRYSLLKLGDLHGIRH
jgi:hypothetical protein